MPIKIAPQKKMFGIAAASAILITGGILIWNQGLPHPNTAPTESGQVFGLRSQVPESFPQDVPLFEPATVRTVTQTKIALQVTLETDHTLEEVLTFYAQGMEQQGWKKTEIGQLGGGGRLWSFKKGSRLLEFSAIWNPEELRTIFILKLPAPTNQP